MSNKPDHTAAGRCCNLQVAKKVRLGSLREPMAETTADYLKRTIGDALARGIAESAAVEPVDSIAFLGSWLKQEAERLKQTSNVNF